MLSKELLSRIRRLEIKTARLVEGAVSGSYLSTFKGRGIEFNEVREYVEGDDVRAIDWNVTARMGVPYVKTFMEERDLTVIIAVDMSASMEFGTASASKSEAALEFASAVALLAVRNNDRVGLIGFTDKVELFVPPKKGRRHSVRVMMELAAARPSALTADPALAAGFVMKAEKSRATVFWVSDFIDMELPRTLKALSKRHELVPVVVRDRRESEVPDVGIVEFTDPETGARRLVDTSSKAFREAFSRMAAEREARRSGLFRAMHAEPVDLVTGGSPVLPLARHFDRQARKRRR